MNKYDYSWAADRDGFVDAHYCPRSNGSVTLRPYPKFVCSLCGSQYQQAVNVCLPLAEFEYLKKKEDGLEIIVDE